MSKRSAFGSLQNLSLAADLKIGEKVYIIVPYLESTAPQPWKIIRAFISNIKLTATRRPVQLYQLEPDREYLRLWDLTFSGTLPPFTRVRIYRHEDEAERDKVVWYRFVRPALLPLALPSNKKRKLKYMGGIGVLNLH